MAEKQFTREEEKQVLRDYLIESGIADRMIASLQDDKAPIDCTPDDLKIHMLKRSSPYVSDEIDYVVSVDYPDATNPDNFLGKEFILNSKNKKLGDLALTDEELQNISAAFEV